MVYRVCISFACLAVLTISAGCGNAAEHKNREGETTLDRIKRTGVIRVGYANEAPYAYLDSRTDSLTGEAPEVLRAVMKSMGVNKVEGVLTEFGALIPGLRAKRFDIIAAGMYITPERCQQIAFSNPSYSIGEAFIVQTGNPKALHSYADVAKHESATIGVMAGAVERGYATGSGIPDARIVLFPDAPSGLEAVQIGRVDAFAGTSLTIRSLLSKTTSSKIEVATPFTDPVIDGKEIRGYGAFGFRNEDSFLLDGFNGELAKFIGSPEHLALVAPFGFTENELPGNVTAAELCGTTSAAAEPN
ncbi:MAG: ectoine/hydroxyectoine ABC transporter substrate-binding protein EhuB [Candidatus Hydrogenedentes bacterium]|nr:ectoine/hydroxyectoine ABC transporter substrate-binding protein EhuB [Candidatus Hydrogenedentota bacterium]